MPPQSTRVTPESILVPQESILVRPESTLVPLDSDHRKQTPPRTGSGFYSQERNRFIGSNFHLRRREIDLPVGFSLQGIGFSLQGMGFSLQGHRKRPGFHFRAGEKTQRGEGWERGVEML